MFKYLLIGVLFSSSAKDVEVVIVDTYDTHIQCEVNKGIHSNLYEGDDESLQCVEIKIK
ncbi:hypothetical protein [Nitrosomonas marina]|uniref:Uncharacterized protein n=1 Tax=Nitrosomonas marina TaxID=917 RepID=A0A1H8ISY4_9PROT|nr:hypothetical protein [Nitrosomonas marina]SEN71743.1 hypothetical protein SAMN05216325_14010 [Nitrosomonas marina]